MKKRFRWFIKCMQNGSKHYWQTNIWHTKLIPHICTNNYMIVGSEDVPGGKKSEERNCQWNFGIVKKLDWSRFFAMPLIEKQT